MTTNKKQTGTKPEQKEEPITMNNILLYFAIKYSGNWEKIYKALESHEPFDKKLLEEYAKKYKGKYLTIFDEKYPEALKELIKPPFVFFYKGNLNLLDKPIIWPYGSTITKVKEIVGKLKQNIITGFTDEIEKEVLNSANPKKLIVVKDSGIDGTLILPKALQDKIIKGGGLIISEYPDYTTPNLRNWRESNKFKIALSKGMFLINSLKNRNLFMMIAETIEGGKDIYALADTNPENHNGVLIDKGAQQIKDVKEFDAIMKEGK